MRACVFFCLIFLLLTPAARTQSTDAAPVAMTLPNGIRLLVKREPDAPLVAMQVFVRVGVGQETAQTAGESQFVARTLLLSTTSRPPSAMTSDIGALGGNVGATWTPDWTQINALTVPDRLHQTVGLLMDVLQNADFDAEGVEDARMAMQGERENTDADIFATAYSATRPILYAGTPYAQSGNGTEASLKRLDRADLQKFFQRYYTPKNTTIVIVGNVDPSEARQEIETATSEFSPARLARHADVVTQTGSETQIKAQTIKTTLPGATQIAVLVSYRVPPPSDADYPAILVTNALLGGMKSSRLFAIVRDAQGLAYEIASNVDAQQIAADLTAFAFAAPPKTTSSPQKNGIEPLTDALTKQFEAIKKTPPTLAELTRAQHFLVGTYKIRHERIEDRATLLGTSEMQHGDGGKFDTDYAKYINAITQADIQRVTAKYFTNPVISQVTP